MSRLCGLVEQQIRTNGDISARMRRVERSLFTEGGDEMSSWIRDDDEESQEGDTSTIGPRVCPNDVEEQFPASQGYTNADRHAFEIALQASRVYLRAEFGHSQSSLTTLARRTAAISMFSLLSLAEVSNISVFSLPIDQIDIANSHWYVFGIAHSDEEEDINQHREREEESDTKAVHIGQELEEISRRIAIDISRKFDMFEEDSETKALPIRQMVDDSWPRSIVDTRKQFDIFIRTMTGKTISFKIYDGSTCLQLKEKIREKEGMPFEDQCLVFEGKWMPEATYLWKWKHQEATISLLWEHPRWER
jgi:hypothetical protein